MRKMREKNDGKNEEKSRQLYEEREWEKKKVREREK